MRNSPLCGDLGSGLGMYHVHDDWYCIGNDGVSSWIGCVEQLCDQLRFKKKPLYLF